MVLLYWTESWRILLLILCDLCCTAGTFTLKHLEDGHVSERNMLAPRIRHI
jgi:hypothetical protein